MLSLDIFTTIMILIMFITTHPVDSPCGRKPEYPEKATTFESVDRLFSPEFVARIEPTISEVKGACSNDSATETTRATEAPSVK